MKKFTKEDRKNKMSNFSKPEIEIMLKRAYYCIVNTDLVSKIQREKYVKEVDEIKEKLGINKLNEVMTWDGKITVEISGKK